MVSATAFGKINLHLGVGLRQDDGYHELATVFQSVSVSDTVSLIQQDIPGELVTSMHTTSHVRGDVPDDPTNLAWRAVEVVAEDYQRLHGMRELPSVSIEVYKRIPIAGGMAGGSADAAAALVVANHWLAGVYGVEALSRDELMRIGATLGADVPFCVYGHTALGVGRGDELTAMMSRGTYQWALIFPQGGLSTPRVFQKFDELGIQPSLSTDAVAAALMTGSPRDLAPVLHNDLQAAALSLRPDLRTILTVGEQAGALRGIVSGSGPTCAFLCDGDAPDVIAEVTTAVPGTTGLTVEGPAGAAALN